MQWVGEVPEKVGEPGAEDLVGRQGMSARNAFDTQERMSTQRIGRIPEEQWKKLTIALRENAINARAAGRTFYVVRLEVQRQVAG